MVIKEAFNKSVCPICGCNHLMQEDNPRNYDNFMSIPHSCNKCGAYVGDWYVPVNTVMGKAFAYAVTIGLDAADDEDFDYNLANVKGSKAASILEKKYHEINDTFDAFMILHEWKNKR